MTRLGIRKRAKLSPLKAARERFGASILLCSLVATAAAARDAPPLPPRRPNLPPASKPVETKPAEEKPSPELTKPGEAAETCFDNLRAAGVLFEQTPASAAPLDGCGINAPVRLSALTLGDRRVAFNGTPQLDCPFAIQFADFVKNLLTPLGAAMMEAPLVAIDSGPGYECRARNRQTGGKLSAHGKGIAIDLSAFIFSNGRRVAVEKQDDPQSTVYFKTLRTAACGWFTTVLGPGSDAAHANHLHVDIERHGSSDAYRICQ